jgi:hypothetical protein
MGVDAAGAGAGRDAGDDEKAAVDAVFIGANPLAVEFGGLEEGEVDRNDLRHVNCTLLVPAGGIVRCNAPLRRIARRIYQI